MKASFARATAAVTLLAVAAAACSATGEERGFDGSGGGGEGAGVGSGGAGADGAGGDLSVGTTTAGPDGGPGAGCSQETSGSIYVLGDARQLCRFEPASQSFTVLGTLSCPGAEQDSTFSMAVDRKGIAWVLFQDGRLFHVDTKTLACTQSALSPCQQGFCNFGMGFVSDAPGSDAETLFISGVYNVPPGGVGLAKIAGAELAVVPIADYDQLPGKGAELTGTGDARLFGYFQDTPIRLAEIDKADAHIVSLADLSEVPVGTSWAFAFWGGSFYILSGPAIRKYDPATKITTMVNANVGFDMVGAGVSTCAPIQPPK